MKQRRCGVSGENEVCVTSCGTPVMQYVSGG